MRRVGTARGLAVVAAAVLMLAGCSLPPEEREGRDLAETVKIDGYHKVGEEHKAETTSLYFVGPPGVDLTQAVSARGWSPQPPPDLPEVGAFKWVTFGHADTDGFVCSVVVSILRPGFESVAIELNERERQDLTDGKLVYVQVTSVCAQAP